MDIEKTVIPFNKPVFFRQTFLSALDDACSTSSCSFNNVLDKKKKEATECSSCYITSTITTEGRSDDITVMQLSGDGEQSHKCTNFFREKYGYERSLLTPSCTAALEMAALLLDIQPGDEVIVPSFTFVTTASSFALRGAKIVFADSEDETPNVSVSDILNKISARTKAIVIVHYAGISVDVPLILRETLHSIPVVEDCAHALDAFDKNSGDFLGKAGCLATFSFHETKNVGIGEGGLLVVNDHRLWSKARSIREKGTNLIDFKEGKVPFYTWTRLGSSYLMSEVNAAVLWMECTAALG
mmetsp:Transcript_1662/g.3038  ORF Transcript_1662/g.3038 Transcript_1662/m.3038 type:complete len:299 (+) Transcript_1662:1040-1936(+)